MIALMEREDLALTEVLWMHRKQNMDFEIKMYANRCVFKNSIGFTEEEKDRSKI